MTHTEILTRALELLAVSTFYNPELQAKRTDVIEKGLEALAQSERHELQAKGEHPAPCARHCEATAFGIVIKNLKAQLAQSEQEPVAWMDADGNVSDNNDHKCFPIPLYTKEQP